MTEDQLLAAIDADPESAGPRLVYADWLDQHGQPERARLFRIEVEAEGLPEADPRRIALQVDEEAIIDRSWSHDRLTAPLREQLGDDAWEWTSGPVITRIEAGPFRRLVDLAEPIRRFGVEHLHVRIPDHRTEAMGVPVLPGVRGLFLHPNRRTPDIGPLLHSRLPSQVRTLGITGQMFTSDVVRSVLDAGDFGRLGQLVLSCRGPALAGLVGQTLPALRALGIVFEQGPDSQALRELDRWEGLEQLDRLSLTAATQSQRPSTHSLLGSGARALRSLTSRDMARTPTFERADRVPLLRLAVSDYFRVLDDWLDGLERSPWLRELRALAFGRTEATHLDRLVQLPQMGRLQHLAIEHRGSVQGVLRALASVPHPALCALEVTGWDLWGDEPVDWGVRALVDHPDSKALRSVELSIASVGNTDWTSVSVRAAEHLLRLPNLERLRVRIVAQTAEERERLVDHPALRRLVATGGLPTRLLPALRP